MFFMLAFRLPAYRGVMQAVVRDEVDRRPSSSSPSSRGRGMTYEPGSPQANNAHTADHAPPATAGTLAALDMQLGGGWISHKVVKVSAEDVTPK